MIQKHRGMAVKMLDLKGQYEKIKVEIDNAISTVLEETAFIQGPQVKSFESNLAAYLGVSNVISCANGTDALQIALMALDLKPGDEVIVPAFTYIATAEVIALLGLTPVPVDVLRGSFNIDPNSLKRAISCRSKAIVPVHLFGQSASMDEIMEIAREHSLFVIEDNAQALGAKYFMKNGETKSCGTIGDIGCTSFFPSKNLGCFGDGGAIMTNDPAIAQKLRMIANHGQKVKYYHDIVGCNSRLDTIQAAVLDVKLKHLDSYAQARYNAAIYYNDLLKGVGDLELPMLMPYSTHVFHQYTLCTSKRDELKMFLEAAGIPSMVYYPLPLHRQKAFEKSAQIRVPLDVSESLSERVISLPIHTEITLEQQQMVSEKIIEFFKK